MCLFTAKRAPWSCEATLGVFQLATAFQIEREGVLPFNSSRIYGPSVRRRTLVLRPNPNSCSPSILCRDPIPGFPDSVADFSQILCRPVDIGVSRDHQFPFDQARLVGCGGWSRRPYVRGEVVVIATPPTRTAPLDNSSRSCRSQAHDGRTPPPRPQVSNVQMDVPHRRAYWGARSKLRRDPQR